MSKEEILSFSLAGKKSYFVTYENSYFRIHEYNIIGQARWFIYVLSAAAGMLRRQSWVAATEIWWTTKSKKFTISLFIESVC